MSEDELFHQAFGEHTGVSDKCREKIERIRNNTNGLTYCNLDSRDVVQFTDQAWELLGRYIVNNNNLSKLVLRNCSLTDEKMVLLFRSLARSESLTDLNLNENSFGIEGVRCMIPFLQNSPNLTILNLGGNSNINNEGFKILVQRLDGKSATQLHCHNCNITDISSLEVYNLPNLQTLNLSDNSIHSISALDTYTLPNLETLCLNHNNIGRDGCIILSNLLKKEGSTLTALLLAHTNMGDEEAEIIATSLKYNTTLKILDLRNNKGITERCYRTFLKLLVDVSSIENTYNSNHTLKNCFVGQYMRNDVLDRVYCEASAMNQHGGSNPISIGRLKVIKYQLNSTKRKNLCSLQGIEYCSNPFADIEPILLPNIISLIGEKRGQSDLYAALLPMAPDLLSYIDREAMIDSEVAKNMIEINALTQRLSVLSAKNQELSRRREIISLGSSSQQPTEEVGRKGTEIAGGKKRKV